TRTTAGPIIDVGLGSDLHLSNVQVSGATVTNATSFDGVGINCVNDQTSRKLELTDVIVTGNAGDGVDGSSCAVSAKRSAFTNNGGQTPNQGSGLYVKDHLATIDQCDFSRNTSDGLTFDGTVLTVSNSFFYNNFANGLLVSTGDPGGQIQFSTIVGNGKFGLSIGQPSNDSFELSNNLIGNNPSGSVQCAFGTCPLTGSIVLGADVSSAHFKNATTDLHIMAGSVAIDAATNATLDHDFDGDVRPLGNGRDVGADEAQ
ncbi:MAG: right-handed parallel beta-helix repeat-containing protein, partial [Kofleriaceae bacterium]